ncbi:MAG: hypothetical protein EI684_05085 [Candidatus Viridilinea halotolerans]|uniref:Uncharacterized protein n=1 Tax=Candidatus Viridilinea halotolerans TaxID=2491704 RepID=A0A426U5S8_9CHLR|nr:MAG: hypothetical protein EI684_05085 [Candidatus Viridilinea halotolerans]
MDMNTIIGEMERREAIATSAGATDGNKILRTRALDGKIDESFLPASGGVSAETVIASESLAAGDWIHFHVVSGQRRIRRANAADNTKPAQGYVTTACNSGEGAQVFTSGINGSVATTGFVAGDVGVSVFLSATTSGGCSKTPPSTTGNVVQRLGFVAEVGGSVRVQFDKSPVVRL